MFQNNPNKREGEHHEDGSPPAKVIRLEISDMNQSNDGQRPLVKPPGYVPQRPISPIYDPIANMPLPKIILCYDRPFDANGRVDLAAEIELLKRSLEKKIGENILLREKLENKK